LKTDPLGINVNSDMGEGEDIEVNNYSTKATGGYNDKGYFDIDLPNHRILIRNHNESQIILRYVSTGIEDMETTYIPVEAINYIKAELEYKLEFRNPKLTNGQKVLMKQAIDEATSKMDVFHMPEMDELIDAIYETSGRGARRW
jgi:hypothetical protein